MPDTTTKLRYRKVGNDEFGYRRVKVVDYEGMEGFVVSFTESCSGCFEFNEGLGLDAYEYDDKNGCYIGAGCEECGYTGKRRQEHWVPFDEHYEAYERYLKTL